jgi:hypothetical protein
MFDDDGLKLIKTIQLFQLFLNTQSSNHKCLRT